MRITEFTNPIEFQRFCSLLFSAEDHNFQSIDDSGGDLGIDGYIADSRIFMIYCPEKPQKNNDSKNKSKISSDIKKAVKTIKSKNLSVNTLVFVTPMNLRTEVILYLEKEASNYGFKSVSYGEDKLTELAAKHPHIVKQFPLMIFPDIEAKIDKVREKMDIRFDCLERLINPAFHDKKGEKSVFVIEPRLEKALKSYEDGDVDKAVTISREVYYETSNDRVKLQAIINIVTGHYGLRENVSELIPMCDEGIKIAEKVKNQLARLSLMAQKALLLSDERDFLLLDRYFIEQVAYKTGIFNEAEYEHINKKIGKNQEDIESILRTVIEDSRAKKMYKALANMYLISGLMNANSYIILAKTYPEVAGFCDNRCKTAFSESKKIYAALGDEEGVVNVTHNLSNHLRSTGEIELSKKYAREVIAKAKSKGYFLLELKASELLYALEHTTPDYYNIPPSQFLDKLKKRREMILKSLKNKK
ncbi:hypothetical protein M0R36_08280 [bacterium]|jgi:hypothetical protein|nr:hypothetical protein [bacterium]